MKKSLSRLTFIILFSVIISSFFTAAASGDKVVDEAELFTLSEKNKLEERISELSEKLGYEFVILTTDDSNGVEPEQNTKNFYNENLPGTNAVIFLIDMDNREFYINSFNNAMTQFTYDNQEKLLDRIFPYAKDGEYYKCADVFLDGMDRYMSNSIPIGGIIIIIGVSIGAGAIFYFSTKSRYNSVGKKEKYPFREQGTLNLRHSSDVLVNKYITSVKRQSSSSSGGSGRSRSSGSRGGGRKF